MTFSSLIFLTLFLPLFLLSYFVIKNRKYRNFVILIFSLLFYAWGEPVYIFLILFSILVNYLLALLIDKKREKKYLILAVAFNLGLLIYYKYTNFIIDIFNINIKELNVILPIGISFYTFQILSYIIDVYYKKVKVQKNIFYLGCYITFFPQLIAGPIVRYETIEDELSNRKETLENFQIGIRRFITGLGKKVLIADNVGYIATQVLQLEASSYGFIGVIFGMLAYSLQIYFDFSGYSDMAIGLGKMTGFNFLENFNYPYIAKSITDFWRRWHISLSTFFRDYVYIPLGGNKKRHILNIMIVWSLTGLWHGASVNFIIWGMYYGLLLLIEKLFLNKYLKKAPTIIQRIYTLVIVMIGWGIFKVTTFNEVKDLFSSMIFSNGLGDIKIISLTGVFNFKYLLSFILGLILSTPIMPKLIKKINNQVLVDIGYILIFILSIIKIVVSSYSPFIYFRF